MTNDNVFDLLIRILVQLDQQHPVVLLEPLNKKVSVKGFNCSVKLFCKSSSDLKKFKMAKQFVCLLILVATVSKIESAPKKICPILEPLYFPNISSVRKNPSFKYSKCLC